MHLGHFIICTSRTRFIALGLVPPNASATNGQQLAHHLTHPLRPSSYSSKQVIRKGALGDDDGGDGDDCGDDDGDGDDGGDVGVTPLNMIVVMV